jgi:hypothetical protein
MRDIKFRIWDNLKKVYLKNKNVSIPIGKPILQHEKGILFEQFIGIKDKDGREIYEGDLIECFGDCGQKTIREVVFEDGVFLPERTIAGMLLDVGVVVGNIHENPEMIK